MGIMNRQALLMVKLGSELGFSPAARASLGSSAPAFTNGATAGRTSRAIKGGLAGYLEQNPDAKPN
jgi:phage terminase small subunit